MNTPTWQIKKQMCDIGQRIWQRGYCAGNEGNHTVRIADDRVICTPTGLSKGWLGPDDMCVVDLDGVQVEPNSKGRKRTSEILLHAAVYKHRPDVRAIIHSHPPHATAFAIAEIPLPEGIHPEAEVFLGRVPTAKFAMPSTQDLPDSVVALVGPETNTVLMGNHGSVSFSHDLIDAYYKLEILDNYCRILLLCQQLGRANVLSNEQNEQLLEIKKKFGLSDARVSCAADGCVGQNNQPFLATFDVHPASAACACGSGPTESSDSARKVIDDDAFESLVGVITNQIMDKMT